MDDFNKYDTAFNPCPQCGAPVEGYEARPEYVRSNPDSVMSIRNPDCPHESDPEADCTCTSYISPAPNPMLDRMVKVGAWFTFSPCGHQFEQSKIRDWKVTRTVKPGWHQAQLDQLVADAAEHGVSLRFP